MYAAGSVKRKGCEGEGEFQRNELQVTYDAFRLEHNLVIIR